MEVLVHVPQLLALHKHVVLQGIGVDLLEHLIAILVEEGHLERPQRSQLDFLVLKVLFALGYHFLILLAEIRSLRAFPGGDRNDEEVQDAN